MFISQSSLKDYWICQITSVHHFWLWAGVFSVTPSFPRKEFNLLLFWKSALYPQPLVPKMRESWAGQNYRYVCNCDLLACWYIMQCPDAQGIANEGLHRVGTTTVVHQAASQIHPNACRKISILVQATSGSLVTRSHHLTWSTLSGKGLVLRLTIQVLEYEKC